MENKKSLYRIYRPKNFSELAGHKNVKEILMAQLKNNNFPNALLFTGQRGTGKTSLAKIFAKAVNCLKIIDNYEPCNECFSCISVNNNNNIDVFEIDAASNNGVDEIRHIKTNTSMLPVNSKYKVFIIDEVHMLSNSAFNALLKTLEEPPKYVIFILATTEYFKIPQTIISRCQIFNFKKISQIDLQNKLIDIAKKEGVKIEIDALSEIFYMSDGSLRDSLNYLEQCMTIANDEIKIEHLKKIFYITTKNEKLEIIKCILQKDSLALINFFESGLSNGLDFDSLSLSLLNILKEIIEFKLTSNFDFLSQLNNEDLLIFKDYDVELFFTIANNLSDVYSKTKNTNVNFQYLLINLLNTLISLSNNSEEKYNEKDLIVNNAGANIKEELQITKNVNPLIKTLEFNFVENKLPEEGELKTMSDFVKMKLEKTIDDNAINLDEIIIEDKKILGVLGSANKEIREKIQNKLFTYFEIDENNKILNKDMAKKYIMFLENKVVAANKNGCVILCDTRSNAKWINHKFQNKEFRFEFFKDFELDLAVIAIDKIKWKNIREEYIILKESNNLLPIDEFNLEEFYNSVTTKSFDVTTENEYLKRLIEIIGKENIKVV